MILPPLPHAVPAAVAVHAAAAVACAHVTPSVLLLADLTAPATTRRLVVVSLRRGGAIEDQPRVVLRTQVAQGRGGWSNAPGSLASSAGLYRIGPRYVGKHGASWRLAGLTPGWDNHAVARDVVLHAAWYVRPGWAGQSWGCPALSHPALARLARDGLLPPRQPQVYLFIQGPGIGHAAPLACTAGRVAAFVQSWGSLLARTARVARTVVPLAPLEAL